MSSNGFYRRRRGLLEHMAAGRITLFDDGLHDFLCLNAQSRFGTGSAVPPGVWVGSARKIYLLTGRHESERQIRRSLEKLTRIGWIKRWHEQGRRGDYPILISKLVVRDASGRDFVVSAEDTTDWRHPTLLPCSDLVRDLSVKRPRTARDLSGLLQEGKNEEGKKKEIIGRSVPGVPERLFEIWNEERKTLPEAKKLTKERRQKCLARMGSNPDFPNTFRAAVRKARETPFCCGARGWKVTFDWLLENDKNCLKVIEGNYDDQGGRNGAVGARGKDSNRSNGRGTTMAGALRESASFPFKPSEI